MSQINWKWYAEKWKHGIKLYRPKIQWPLPETDYDGTEMWERAFSWKIEIENILPENKIYFNWKNELVITRRPRIIGVGLRGI